MILLDFQQTAIANAVMIDAGVIQNPFEDHDNKTSTDIMRIMLLRAIRTCNDRFKSKFGSLVLCCDSPVKTWRREVFPFYKFKRRAAKKTSLFDWDRFHTDFTIIKNEFRENLPYKLIEVERAEGDDIIAVLCAFNETKKTPEDVLIFSSDKDFKQLQRHPHVKQWNKFKETYVITDNWLFDLREHIIRGDVDDGVPNIMSASNCLAEGVRQSPIFTKKVEEWKMMDPIFAFEGEILERYERNRQLIDLECIPNDIKLAIFNEYMRVQPATRKELYKYFIRANAGEMIHSLGDF